MKIREKFISNKLGRNFRTMRNKYTKENIINVTSFSLYEQFIRMSVIDLNIR
jgi:hypothetical protein